MVERLRRSIRKEINKDDSDSDLCDVQDSEAIDPLDLNIADPYIPDEKLSTCEIPDGKQKCAYCLELYDKCQLADHLRVLHYGRKQHTCVWINEDGSKCGKHFTRLDHLARHNRAHEGLKLFKCDKCSKDFTRKDHMKKHRLTHQGTKNSYHCKMCNTIFQTSRRLKEHKCTHSMASERDTSNRKKGGKVLKASQVLGM